MRKLIARVCALALVVTSLIADVSVPENVQAADTKQLNLKYVKDANEIADLDWTIEKSFDPHEAVTDEYTMNLKTDTYLYVSTNATCDVTSHLSPEIKVSIYSDKKKTKLLDSIEPSIYYSYVTLVPKGTYYVDIKYDHSHWSSGHEDNIDVDVQIVGLKVKDTLTFSTKENKDGSVYVTATNHAKTGNYTYEPSFYVKKTDTSPLIRVNDATYTVYYEDEGVYHYYLTDYMDYDFKYIIDKTGPKVHGIKDGKTYKDSVKFKFSDKLSGIKSATLDGKEIENHWMCDKKGKHVLKVWDKSGNKTVVKFTIK